VATHAGVIFGLSVGFSVRSMTTAGLRRKTDIDDYVREIEALAG
jgi:hypothetical protein